MLRGFPLRNGRASAARWVVAASLGSAARGQSSPWEACQARFEVPDPGKTVLHLNGVQLPDVCISTEGTHEVFIIGDWGGLYSPGKGAEPADHRAEGVHKRPFVRGLDDWAQQKVRDRMVERAAQASPEYVLNVGDNFYWAGVDCQCGKTRENPSNFSRQWDAIFEDFYSGEGMDGVQWLGVLGNHDWGGFLYSNGWDQAIMYTWKDPKGGKPRRWVTPALYWRSTVRYLDFSVDYFFIDTNIFDANSPYDYDLMENNICSFTHNPFEDGAGDCSAEGGPVDVDDCYNWFQKLWLQQLDWLHLQLSNSTADWQVVVTHFPPSFDKELFADLTTAYGIDLFITGHLHRQEVHGDDESNFLAPTPWVVSGGGGGITSDFMPDLEGDSQYGYMRMTLSKDHLEVVNIVHTGADGDSVVVSQRPCYACTEEHIARNLKRLKKGLRERGHLGDTTTTTGTSTTSRTSETVTVTATSTSVQGVVLISGSPHHEGAHPITTFFAAAAALGALMVAAAVYGSVLRGLPPLGSFIPSALCTPGPGCKSDSEAPLCPDDSRAVQEETPRGSKAPWVPVDSAALAAEGPEWPFSLQSEGSPLLRSQQPALEASRLSPLRKYVRMPWAQSAANSQSGLSSGRGEPSRMSPLQEYVRVPRADGAANGGASHPDERRGGAESSQHSGVALGQAEFAIRAWGTRVPLGETIVADDRRGDPRKDSRMSRRIIRLLASRFERAEAELLPEAPFSEQTSTWGTSTPKVPYWSTHVASGGAAHSARPASGAASDSDQPQRV